MKLHEAKYDLCHSKTIPDMIKLVMAGWAIPDYCPVKENFTFSYNPKSKIKMSAVSQKMLELFSVEKSVNVKMIITHDTGTSCFEAMNSVIKIN